MNKLRILIKLILSNKFVLITATGVEENPWLASPHNITDEEFQSITELDWEDVE